eukprot:3941522-Rhodomonas_salina.3
MVLPGGSRPGTEGRGSAARLEPMAEVCSYALATPLCCSDRAMRLPVPALHMVLRACYAVSGTDPAYCTTREAER